MHNAKAQFVSLTGREVTFPLIRSQDRIFVVQPNGMFVLFADPLDDPILGQLNLVAVDPPDPALQPV